MERALAKGKRKDVPKNYSHRTDVPLRVLYVADYQSERLIRSREIRNNLHTGGSTKIARIARALGIANCQVTVLASGIVANRSAKVHRGFRDIVEGADADVVFGPTIDIPILSHAVALAFGVWYVLTHEKPDVTVVYNMTALSLSIAYIAKLIKRSPVFFEYEDDCHVPLSGPRLRSQMKGSICMFLALRIASGSICVNRALAAQMSNVPVYVLEGIADVQREGIRREDSSRRSVWHLTYVGGIHRLKGVLSLGPMMKELGPEYSLQIIGDGPMAEELRRSIDKLNLDTISIRGRLDDGELQRVCEMTDIFINPHMVHLGHVDAIFPFKIIEYLSFGKPVVTTQLAESALEALGGLQSAESDDPKAIATAVRVCAFKYSEFVSRMPAVRAFIWENYSVEQVGKRLRKFLHGDKVEWK
jgi:glycosyltransferase involved in cell wall biosynthesis